MKEKRWKLGIALLFLLIFLIGIIFYFYQIISWRNDVNENRKLSDYINENIKIIDNLSDVIKYEVDFNKLKEINKNTIAYIKVNGTNIDYVIVKGNDNSYYLNHNFENKYNVAGWIFADYRNKFDESDKNLIIYGHNIKDGSMFDTLKYVLDKDWYEDENNHNIVLITENGTYYYKVFSSYSIIPEDYYISTDFNNLEEFGNFINVLKDRSIYNYGVDVNKDDKILTLSSCLGEGEKRVVLHAKLDKKIE